MSKETTFGIECPGCFNKITFVEYHRCPELAEAVAAMKTTTTDDEKPKRKRRKRTRRSNNA